MESDCVTLTNAYVGKFRGFCRAPVNSEWWQPADTQLPLVYQQLHVSPVHHLPSSELTPWWIETKRPHILFMCQKCGERSVGRRERGVSLYPSVDIIPSMRINSPRQWQMRKERAWGGREGEGRRAEMVVVLICQRNTALRVLLKCSHKPELSEVGRRILTFCQTWIVDFLLGLAVHSLIHQLRWGKQANRPLLPQYCHVLSVLWKPCSISHIVHLRSIF